MKVWNPDLFRADGKGTEELLKAFVKLAEDHAGSVKLAVRAEYLPKIRNLIRQIRVEEERGKALDAKIKEWKTILAKQEKPLEDLRIMAEIEKRRSSKRAMGNIIEFAKKLGGRRG